jgi:3',5'-cyclic AMP phosphodiesterase CpdA
MRRAQRITASSAELGCTPAERPVIYTLAHLSDLHATPVAPRGPAPLVGKRFFGWLSWRLRRRHEHQAYVLEALLDDLRETAPDQVAITGDLTNVSLEDEFPAARRWLERIGPPERVMAIPGNHDAYVKVARARAWELWEPWLAPDPAWRAEADAASGFPSVRVRGPLALIGLCSARPTAPFLAGGSLGAAQRARLEELLRKLRERGLARVLLLHHSPVPGAVSARRALWDAPALAALLARTGAELVLHGHLHRTRFDALPGPDGPIPVLCTRSASDRGERAERRAQYHLLGVDTAAGRPRFTLRVRGFDARSGRFGAEGDPRPL